MKTIGIFYGSSTGTTEDIAKRIAAKLGVDASNLYDVAKASPSDLAGYEVLILGSSCLLYTSGKIYYDRILSG